MTIQTVTTILTDLDAVSEQLDKAAGVARAYDAHLQVLSFAMGYDQPGVVQTALDAVPVTAGFDDTRVLAIEIAERAKAALDAEDIRWDIETAAVLRSNSRFELARRTRFSDLVIQNRLPGAGVSEQQLYLAEALLFDADVPVLVFPQEVEMRAPARNIMMTWDESATALRAARLALPLLQAADAVHVALVDPAKDAPDRSDPGGAFAQFLSRHGVKNEVSILNRTDDTVAGTLERRAQEIGCDLIVMGAYGHSRLRQALFGGTTRYMLEHAALPIFLAH